MEGAKVSQACEKGHRMINHDSELPKDVCVFRLDNYTLCGEPRASFVHEFAKLCDQRQEPTRICHPFQPAVADPAPVDQPELDWRKMSIVELAVENQSVSDYIEHWEGRAFRAEQALADLASSVSVALRESERPTADESPVNTQIIEALKEALSMLQHSFTPDGEMRPKGDEVCSLLTDCAC
jgi:hypothetical protein